MMKQFTLLFCTIVLLLGSANAKDNTESLQNKVDSAYSKSFISRFDKVFNSTPDPNNPRGYDATSLLMEADAVWNKLTPAAKSKVDALQGDFDDLSDQIESPSGYFRYHFTDIGSNAIDYTDADANGIPDVVDFYDECFTYAKNNYIAAGYTLPKTSGFYEVYLSNTVCGARVYGFTRSTTFVGDNPGSTAIENHSYQSYIAIRTVFSGFGTPYETSVKITSAHEFFHAIQMAVNYVINPDDALDRMFIMEGCAVWSEEWNYKNNFDAFQYLSEYFQQCDIQLDYSPDASLGNNDKYYTRPYGDWIFFRYLTDLYGQNIIKELYYNQINTQTSGLSLSNEYIFDKTLLKYGTNFRNAVKYFFISQFIFPKLEDKKPVYWSLASEMAVFTATHEKTLVLTASTPLSYSSQSESNKRLEMLGVDYLMVNFLDNAGGATFTLTPGSKTDTMCLVVIKADQIKNPTKFEYQEVMLYGNSPQSIIFKRDESMPVTSMAVMNLKLAKVKGVSSNYTINVNPDVLSVNETQVDGLQIKGIFPTPAENNSNLNINVKELGLYNYSIYNIDGKLMTNGSFVANLYENSIPLNLSELNTGIYLIKVSNGKESKAINFIVK
jgi:hypothetical protein